MKDCQSIIEEIYGVATCENKGIVASNITELSKVGANKFGVCLTTVEEKLFAYGDFKVSFKLELTYQRSHFFGCHAFF